MIPRVHEENLHDGQSASLPTTLLRCSSVCAIAGASRSKVYADVQEELLPPPIRFSPRYSRWLATELDAVLTARISGASDEAVRMLVRTLVSKRGRIGAEGRR